MFAKVAKYPLIHSHLSKAAITAIIIRQSKKANIIKMTIVKTKAVNPPQMIKAVWIATGIIQPLINKATNTAIVPALKMLRQKNTANVNTKKPKSLKNMPANKPHVKQSISQSTKKQNSHFLTAKDAPARSPTSTPAPKAKRQNKISFLFLYMVLPKKNFISSNKVLFLIQHFMTFFDKLCARQIKYGLK